MTNLTELKTQLVAQNIALVQVVAFDNKNAIGKNNQLAWHIPEDLQHFKAITTGGVVVMGRKTFESMGKPLPNRINWVITRDKNWSVAGVKVAHSLTEALKNASLDVKNSEKNQSLFIIGGGEIFAQTLPMCDVLEVTRIDLDIDGDAFYPTIGDDFVKVASQSGVSQKTGTAFTFERYTKNQNTVNQ